MSAQPTLTAVLGPTNTGKTHLAVERMCGHSSGMIGFPLRLLAREVYDRVVKLKGAAQVALITGEEKILPPGARYFLCTAESMPSDRDVAFVALDEAQMGADRERGHVFTDRLLHTRGRDETMILGAETLRPLIRRLLPDAEIVTRPRFSTLSYVGAKKLSRLPKRSAIVAFTAADVYALAEMLRRHKGGAAVVMGALSPRTRNAQVELYQSGEVDYLVATDAIGMGLNMDIAHVAFASLSKFDGRRFRRLTTPELAQIGGRAGRHQRDGGFGTVQLGHDAGAIFTPEEVEAIEQHRFPPLEQLVWRNARLDFATLPRLVASLEERPNTPGLARAPDDAIDLAVLKRMAGEPWVMERGHGKPRLQRLWAACGLPDYRKTGPEQHARLVGRVFRHLTEAHGHLPPEWIASELAVLDNVSGDIAHLSDRIAAARTWTYIAHRPGWLADGAHWAERTRQVEDKLSDALHQRLAQRFVDRRTSVLLRDVGARGRDLAVVVDEDGTVAVEGEEIGTLVGFGFTPDPAARAGERRLLLAAAEKHLTRELDARACALVADPDERFDMAFDGGMPPRLLWRGARVGKLRPGRDTLCPKVELDRSLDSLAAERRGAILERLERWLAHSRDAHLRVLTRISALMPQVSGPARGLIVQLVETMGVVSRERVQTLIAGLADDDRKLLARAGVTIGHVHVFARDALKPAATRWRLALWGVAEDVSAMPAPPGASRVAIPVAPYAPRGFYEVAGFWPVGTVAVRVDKVDRLAARLAEIRDAGAAIPADPAWSAALGIGQNDFLRLMRALGFRPRLVEGAAAFEYRGRQTLPPERTDTPAAASPFAVLAGLRQDRSGG